ncbi:hypothetical protein A9Q78_10550 [Methylophaga sp. 41_12_T18]|nr:hypothetical protein A9Q78_10550 [Methylophaga sp. 41_12_T18]
MMKKQSREWLLSRDVYCIFGLPFDVTNLYDAVHNVSLNIGGEKRYFFSTPNLNFVIAAQSDPEFFQSVVDSDLSVADGMPIIWVAKLLGIPLPERVAGSSLFDELSMRPAYKNKINVFFFGGQKGIAEQAHNKLNETSIGMKSCGFYDPGFVSVDEMSSTEIIQQLNRANPDFIVVALGAKKGQQWIQHNKHQLNAPVISHLGAVINFVAGNIERAPIVWQKFGLEWLWRIKQEPVLWKRYLSDGLEFSQLLVSKVIPLALYDRYLKRTGSFKNRLELSTSTELTAQVVSIGGCIHHQNMMMVKQQFSSLLDDSDSNIVIDCAGLTYFDAAFLGTLLLFQRYLNEQKKTLTLQAVPKRIIRIISLNNVLTRFTIVS